jgi:outer membrane protein assembly factor BamB
MKRYLLAFVLTAPATLVVAAERPERGDAGRTARRILQATGVQGGLIVHLGCGDGRLTAALRANDRYLVQGLDTDEEDVQKARRHADSLGLYGPVSIDHFDGNRLPYVDNLANLVVAEDLGEVSMDEVTRVLAPLRVALVPGDSAQGSAARGHGTGVRVETVEIGGGRWRKVVKAWPAEIDEWTHWLHDSDSNPVARDTLVGPPRQVQWYAEPIWSRSHEKSPSLTGMVSARGRVFYILDEGPASIGGPLPDRWQLVARDAFNGVLLWKRPVPDWGWQSWSPSEPMNLRWGNPRFIHRRLVAVEDRVYVTLGYGAPVTALDAATGEQIRAYRGTEDTCEILYHHGRLVLSVATQPKTATGSAPPLKIVAVDASSGEHLWEAGPFESLYDLGERGKSNVLKQGRLMIAAGEGHVYCVTQKEVLALGLDDGKPAWRVPRPPAVLPKADDKAVRTAANKMFTNLGSLMVHQGRVFFAQPHVPKRKLVNNVPMTLLCLCARTGKEQWRKTCGDWSYTTALNVYAARGRIWVHADPRKRPYDLLGLAPATGEVEVEYDCASVLTTRHHHRCYRNKATENFLLMGKEGVEYVDLESGAVLPHRWLRGMCLYGIMPANGLLYVPPQACSCNPMTMLQGYWALAAQGDEEGGTRPEARVADRLQRGPAYGQPIHPSSFITHHYLDWPMYRHDPLRSGATQSAVSAPLGECWKTSIGGELTGPVAAGGRLYLGRRDTHELIALDAEDGDVVWRYRTGGAVDTSPTVYRGMLLAGCSDGWVVCLRASDGGLIWRFRAAPRARVVVARDRLESAWPVHGGVMIHDDVAYVTAGRSSYLDGGIRIYRLEPRTGEVLGEKTFFTEQTDQEAIYEGVTSDLLVSDGEALFIRHLRLDPATLELTRNVQWDFKGPQAAKKPDAQRRGVPAPDKPHVYLRSGQGFLDDSLYGRTQFHLDGGEFCHLLCFNEQRSYGFQLSTGTGHFVFFTPGGEGYSILGFDRGQSPRSKRKPIWEQKLPLRVYAMVLAGENLFLAGLPDVVDPNDPLASLEGRKGARLVALRAETGETLAQLELDAPPVFDSLIAARGVLYLADRAGSVICFKGPPRD